MRERMKFTLIELLIKSSINVKILRVFIRYYFLSVDLLMDNSALP